MLPRRLLLLLAAGVACAGALVLAGSRAWPPDARAHAMRARSVACAAEPATAPGRVCVPVRVCASDKPFGPVALALLPAEATPRGQSVRATLRPVRSITRLTWHWELSSGVTLLEGGSSGEAESEAGVVTTLDALLLPPAGSQAGYARLVAEAQFEGADDRGPTGPETAIQTVELHWGADATVDMRTIEAPDALTGEPASFALVPSTQRPGR